MKTLFLIIHWTAGSALLLTMIYKGAAAIHPIKEKEAPEKELKFIFALFALAAATGVILFFFIPSGGAKPGFWFYTSAEVILFIALFFSFCYRTFVVSRKLRPVRGRVKEMDERKDFSHFEKFSPDDLKRYTGRSGKPALVAYKGKVYDATDSPHWKSGVHFFRHSAGSDLTEAVKGAPHRPSVIEKLPLAGEYDESAEQSGSPDIRELDKLASLFHKLNKLSFALAVALAFLVAERLL